MKQIDHSTGPISKKVLAALRSELNRKVLDFASMQRGANLSKELTSDIITEDGMNALDPLHAVYAYAQNTLSALLGSLIELPMCAKLAQAFDDAEEEYMPSGPPMSPLTGSYFFCWGMFDSCIGKKKETLGTVAIALCRTLEMEPSLIQLFQHMQDSRMGFYIHEGMTDSMVMLKELVTGKQHTCIVPAGYAGRPGEIWYVRVLPDPYANQPLGYSLVFNTPYVIGTWNNRIFAPADPQDWQSFFDRTIPKTGIEEARDAYAHLMKYGLSLHYWNEYVMEAYLNHRSDMIMLAGLPDEPASRPHSPMYANALSADRLR